LEKEWHEEFFRSHVAGHLVVSDSIRGRYLHPRHPDLFPLEKMFELVGDVRGKTVLCFGCGNENSTVILALKGAKVFAFDLSIAAIEQQLAMARVNSVADGIHAIVSAAEELPFKNASFDVVFGSAILHHLPDSIATAVRELVRVMKQDAFAVFSEPVERTELMRRLRKLFPANPELSPYERKLRNEDFRLFASDFNLEFFPYNLFGRLSPLLERGILSRLPAISRFLLNSFLRIDSFLLRIPGVRRLAGVVVLRATRSKTA
jgi:SAM-dependent methyltransferase